MPWTIQVSVAGPPPELLVETPELLEPPELLLEPPELLLEPPELLLELPELLVDFPEELPELLVDFPEELPELLLVLPELPELLLVLPELPEELDVLPELPELLPTPPPSSDGFALESLELQALVRANTAPSAVTATRRKIILLSSHLRSSDRTCPVLRAESEINKKRPTRFES